MPVVTQKEKDTRRARTKAKRRRCGKKCRPLPRAKKGADGPYKEHKIVTLYDDNAEYRLQHYRQVFEEALRRSGVTVAGGCR